MTLDYCRWAKKNVFQTSYVRTLYSLPGKYLKLQHTLHSAYHYNYSLYTIQATILWICRQYLGEYRIVPNRRAVHDYESLGASISFS